MKRNIRYENMPVKTVLNAVKTQSMPFEWSINPYRGCQHGCAFCYARATHAFLGVEADDTFQNRIFMKTNAAEALREQLAKMARSRKGLKGAGRIAIGTATDPYQQVEGSAMLTRRCLEVLAEFPVPVSITTRSPLILRDLDLLRRLPGLTVNMSIGTLRSDIWRDFEPSTPSPRQRLETVARLREEGIAVGVFVAPILPLLSDGEDDLQALVEALAECRPDFVMSSFLRLNKPEVKLWFFRVLREKHPHLTETYASMYRGSTYAPEAYRAPVKHTIRALLDRYGLPAAEPLRSAADARQDAFGGEDTGERPVAEQLFLF
ncbi:SPL family radical SAM protein [Paenibacillus flagellatus]|uniref:Radical SAM protein n=1 Tax=Paenibacillus flagellatus TaxID=2211139 RepID=A0A2V5JYN7_9BACL|nr:radical SAM protein [Paenibacillus flagellatus]PYI51402.1 radical SAM protein [Paenibacillus flagellatus]